MNVTTRNLLISSLSVFLVCLIASTATTVVCAEESNVEDEPYWGNLKAGDVMFQTDVDTHVDECTLRDKVGGKLD